MILFDHGHLGHHEHEYMILVDTVLHTISSFLNFGEVRRQPSKFDVSKAKYTAVKKKK